MKLKKLAKCSLATALIFGSVGAISGCKKDNDNETTEKTDQKDVYNLYVQYMSAKGETPLTYEQWLESIKGDPGEDGKDGISPKVRINETTNYWEISIDNGTNWTSTGVKATGAEGEKGDPGDDAIAPQVRINQTTNYWEISTDNGTTWTSTGVKATGVEGEKGDPGDDAIAPQVRINQDTNYWEISTDNGTTWNSTGVKATGAEGEKGDPGDDAITPQVRINQDTNYWEISTDNGTNWTSTGVKATGENGQDLIAKEVTITYDFNLNDYNLVDEIQNNNLFVKEGFQIGELYWEPSYLVFKMTQKATKGDYFNLYDYFDEIGIGEYFDGWYYKDTKVTDINVVGGDIELEARWKKNFYEFVSYNDGRVGYLYDQDSLTATAYPTSENAIMDLKALTIKDGKFYNVVDFSIHKDGNEELEVYAKTVYLSNSLYPFIYTNGAQFLPTPGTNSPSVEYRVKDYHSDEENDIYTHAVNRIVIVKSPSYNHTNHPIEYIYLVDYETNTARLIDTWRAPGYDIETNARAILGDVPLKFNVKIDGEIKEIKVDYLAHSWFDPNNHIKYNSDNPINNYMGFIVDSEDEEIIVSQIAIKYYEEHYNFALFFKGNVRLDGGSNTSFEVFYYSETEPTESGNYWHYVNGTPVVWAQE